MAEIGQIHSKRGHTFPLVGIVPEGLVAAWQRHPGAHSGTGRAGNIPMNSILLIEDHIGFANAIQRLLASQPDLEIVGVIRSGDEALKILRERKVDLVLVDVSLPAINGIDLVQQIHTEFSHLRCLILSGHMVPKYVERSLDVRASGYILKDDVNGILEGIQRVLSGETYVSQVLRGK